MNFSTIKKKAFDWCRKNSFAVSMIGVLLTMALMFLTQSKEAASKIKPTQEAKKSADTFIPAGYVLVPIEISNVDSLNSLIGKFGTVDLFLPPQNAFDKPRAIGRRVKILRAPLNPHQFAVLVSEEEAPKFVQAESSLFAVVQNPLLKGAVKIVEEKKKKEKRKLIYMNEDRK